MRHTSSAISMNSIWEEIKQSVNSEIDRVFLNVLGGLFISCSILGIIFNITALFFLSNRTTNFKFKVVLKAAACIDILICILAFFIALSFFDGRSPVAFSNTTFCQLWGFLWGFVAKMSVNIVSVSSVMRVVNIYHPSFLNITVMEIIIIVYAIIFLSIESLPFVFGERYNYVEAIGACVPDMVLTNMGPLSLRSLCLSYVPFLLYLLPIPIILSCYLISSYKIIQQKKNIMKCQKRGGVRPRLHFHGSAIITMSSFMGLYLFLQAPLAVYILWTRIRIFSGYTIAEVLGSPWNLPYLPSLVYLVTITLNATLNPIIYYWRLNDFRNFVSNIFRGLSQNNRPYRPVESRTGQVEPAVGPTVGLGADNIPPLPLITCRIIKFYGQLFEEDTHVYYETNL